MAHFARIENKLVTQVIVVNNETLGDLDYPASEKVGQDFIASLGLLSLVLLPFGSDVVRWCVRAEHLAMEMRQHGLSAQHPRPPTRRCRSYHRARAQTT